MFIMTTLSASTNSDTLKLTYAIFDNLLLTEDILVAYRGM
jgi:hypothetical protein